MTPYTLFTNVEEMLPAIAPDSIVSRTIFNEPHLRIILFGFAAGQELSEHTAARAAVLHFLRGEVRLTLGGEPAHVGPGAIVHMQPHLPHSVYAKSETIMVLYMVGA